MGWYRLLLHLYPPSFRRAHGREMVQYVRSMASLDLPRRVIARDLLFDLIRSVPREWYASLTGRRPSPVGLPSPGDPMKNIAGDVRFALRLLVRNPGFTLAAVATLALGIGANTAIFSLADATLLRPVRVADPDNLRVWSWSSSHPDFRDYQERTDVFSGVVGFANGRISVESDGQSDIRNGAFVSGNTFSVLGLPAVIGRQLQPTDDAGPGNAVVAMLEYGYWQSRFAGDPAIVGRVIRANGTPVTIVGVAAEGFRGLTLTARPVIFLPLSSITQVVTGFLSGPKVLEYRGMSWLTVVGRLKPGVTEAQAAEQMDAHYRRLHPAPPGKTDVERLSLIPLTTRALGGRTAEDVRRFVLLLVGVVAFTLLIGCANLANLLLARAAGRRRELAVRLALGATRGRLVRQLLIENVILALLGGAAGLLVAELAIRGLGSFALPGGIQIAALGLSLNREALAAAMALSLGTGLLFGAAPAWRASRGDVHPAMTQGTRSISGRSHARAALIGVQVALSLVLLAGTGLFVRSLVAALNVPLGFQTANSATASVNLGLARYDNARAEVYFEEALGRVQAIPGVTAASWMTFIPTKGAMTGGIEAIDGYAKGAQETVELHLSFVGPEFFEAAGIRMLSGRSFGPADVRGPAVVVINRVAADKYWGGRDPIGGRLRISEKGDWFTVVGVCETTLMAIGEEPPGYAYFPFGRDIGGPPTILEPNHLLVRTAGDPRQVLPLLREQIRAIDPRVAVYDVQPFAAHVGELLMPQRMGVTLFAFFSVLAVSLAAVGIYGVASYMAALRRREIGIRIALGAETGRIRRLVLFQTAAPVALGIGAGLAIAMWSARFASNFMVGVQPTDPMTFAAVTTLLAITALGAGLIPAARASRTDPVVALREE